MIALVLCSQCAGCGYGLVRSDSDLVTPIAIGEMDPGPVPMRFAHRLGDHLRRSLSRDGRFDVASVSNIRVSARIERWDLTPVAFQPGAQSGMAQIDVTIELLLYRASTLVWRSGAIVGTHPVFRGNSAAAESVLRDSAIDQALRIAVDVAVAQHAADIAQEGGGE